MILFRELLHAFIVVIVIPICWMVQVGSNWGIVASYFAFVIAMLVFPFSKRIYRAVSASLGILAYVVFGFTPVAAMLLGIIAAKVSESDREGVAHAVFLLSYVCFYLFSREKFYDHVLDMCGGTREKEPHPKGNFYLWAALAMVIAFAGFAFYIFFKHPPL